MSLEQALAENTAAVRALTAVLQSGALPTAAAPSPTDTKTPRGRAAKTQEPASGTPAAPVPAGLIYNKLEGDPDGTTYWHVEKHRTVARCVPGDGSANPAAIEGSVQIHGSDYLTLRDKYALPTQAAAGQTTAAANSPAAATSSASTASSNGASASLDGAAILAKAKALHAKDGNDGLKKVLDQFGAGSVPLLQAMTDKFPEIAKAFDDALTPPAAGTNLF